MMKNIKLIICFLATVIACKEESNVNEPGNATMFLQEPTRNDPDMRSKLERELKNAPAPKTATDPFTREMKTLDSLFYHRVYNDRDTALARKMIHEDFEFYHDRIGELIDRDSARAAEAMIRKLHDIGNHYHRKLKPGTLRSYPLYNGKELYGAIQQGVNQYHKADTGVLEGTGHFIHLWIKDNNHWKLKRVISYNHEPSAR